MASSGTWRLEGGAVKPARRAEPAPPEHANLAELTELTKNAERRPGGNWTIWVIPLILSLAGIVMIASLTSHGGADGVSFYWLAFRQFQFLCIGVAVMWGCCLVPLRFMRKWSWLLWALAVLMLLGTLVPGLGVKAGGARRWLNLMGLQFQPLEILTLGMPMFLADRLSASKREEFQCFCKPTLSLAVISALPLFFQPNMGGMILVFAICMSMHVVDRGWKYPCIGGLFLCLLFVIMIFVEGYRMNRFLAFLDPWSDPQNIGFQIIQGLVAFSNGGVMGVGVGKGLQKMNYLPAAHTDYIFPAIGEEFGLVGTLFIVSLYAFWTFKSYMLYRRSGDPYTAVLIWGITVSVLFPMFVNLGGVMKLAPLTGIPLPFLSFGGTALVVMWAKVGVLMRIAREISMRATRDAGERA